MVAAVALIGRSNIKLAGSVSNLVWETTKQGLAHSREMKKSQEFTLAALTLHNAEFRELISQGYVQRALNQNGITPYLSDPGARIREEIEAIQQQLGVSPEEAIKYLQSSVRAS